MGKYALLLPKMAANNIRKNGSIYFPYIGISIFAMFTYFVFDLILKNDLMMKLPKGVYALILVGIGFSLLGLIMVPFLYYTNSFLIKRRKKELGLYSILGLEKKHIGIMMLWESVLVYGIVVAAAILLGLVFSRLIFLLLLNLAKLPVDVEFTVSLGAVRDLMLFYAFISGLNLTVNLVQVGKSNPVELMSDARRGEKEPKRVWFFGILGVLALAAGYYMAIGARLDSSVFGKFFLAVLLVVTGTYFLFTSGSIAVLRFCRRRKNFYYRPENFVTVSGMLYRMKKSAASLSNICVFSTMVIITVVCTVAVYLGMYSIVTSNISREFEVYFFGAQRADAAGLKQETAALAQRYGVELEEELDYSYIEIKAYRRDDVFQREGEPYDYVNWAKLILMTQEEYNRLEGTDERLSSGEVLLYSAGPDYGRDTVSFEEKEYTVRRELAECRVARKHPNDTFSTHYVVVFADREELNAASCVYGVDGTEGISSLYGFNPRGGKENLDSFSRELEQVMAAQTGFAQYEDHREHMGEAESMYGGLLFIGIFFGSIFLICLLVIMYYKQITEGFEDQKNFEIMQKVGMSDREIRRTIRKQISMVFGLPLLGALLHTVVGMHMVEMLMGAIGFFETGLLTACTAGGCLVFAVVYSLSYKRTSMVYYRIVKQME